MPDASPHSPSDGPRRRLTYLQEPVEHRLKAPADFIVAYAENASLRDGLATVGVREAAVTALGDLLATAREAYGVRAELFGRRGEAAALRDRTMDAAETAYAYVFDRAKPARRADDALRAALDVGTRESSRTQRLEQMGRFLDGADRHADALEGYGVQKPHIATARAAVEEATTAYQTWDRLDVEVQHDTDERDDEIMRPLDEAMRDLQERGKAAFADDPQMLEFLGLRPQA